jgi:hypothetical protein
VRSVEDLADRLVEYDRRFALDIVGLVVARLGGPADGSADLPRLHSFLARTDAAATQDEPSKTTAQWKLDFAHQERLRLLGLLVAELLHQPEPAD